MLTPLSLKRGPGPLVEFMEEPELGPLAEALVAFANTDGGTILVGVAPDGKITGGAFAEDVADALREAERRCRPPVVTAGVEPVDTEYGSIVVIRVPRSAELHSLDDGRVLVRAGTQNRPLGGEEIGRLASTKSAGDFEAEVVPGASIDDFDEDVIEEYVEKLRERSRRPVQGPTERILREGGFITDDGHPTVAGVLLFADNPRLWLPQSGVVFVRFPGTEPRGENGLAGYGRREEFEGPLARVVERTWDVIWSEMGVGAVVRGLEREDRPEYPPFAVREALVNAVCHRDYRLKGRRIEVRMYSDRLEVISPGGLPGYITVDNIVDEHFSRNPRIVGGLFQWGYIEELGLGIDRMIEEMVQDGHPPPKFDAKPYSFTVTLYNAQDRAPTPEWVHTMNRRQLKAVQYVQENGSITNRDYRRLCPGVSAETLRLDLADLVKKGVLLKIGAKKGTYYILKLK